ncbi:MAG TPA: heparan-alpha-glucosaminide N-acetyltransferase domain-containing protein, partial [Terriglobales bacterium]|nr:heparan-alpha-glucosaminide N-acetyltransferase domain-containing protein [Terriglobales bacterium]
MSVASTNRLVWIDWMRGLACILMFQTHCYDSWLGGDARKSTFLMYSQLLGTLPAPLFLFLAGISLALITDKLLRKNVGAKEITRILLRRGSQIFAFAFLFRLQEYLIAWGWAPWSDLFKVDVLNTIGISMILMALVCGIALRIARTPERRQPSLLIAGVLGMSLIALLTPPLWTSWRPSWLPWPIESYIDGAHNLSAPQPGLFPIFPWTGFAFAGLAAGLVLFSDWGRARTVQTLAVSAVAGVGLIAGARWIDHMPFQFDSVYDYWHTSPNFFVMRVGLLLIIALLSYAWC